MGGAAGRATGERVRGLPFGAVRVLVVDDEVELAEAVARGLRREGYAVDLAHDGEEALSKAYVNGYDLLCLDITMPGTDGREVCRRVRASNLDPQPRVLMLTARDSLDDRIEGLRGGADDYLTKPFAFDELLAHIVALERRAGQLRESGELRVGALTLDPQSRQVEVAGRPVELTVREFDLLLYLMRNANKVISRQRLLNSVWAYGYDPGTKIVDVYIRYLRAKIDTEGQPSLIQTVRGVGYMMAE